MKIFYLVLIILAIIVSCYLIGSISNATLIAKYIYHVDIHEVGSKNAGGTNVGRTCGKKAAYAVIILDVLKTLICVWSWYFIIEATELKIMIYEISPYIPTAALYYGAGVMTCIGHRFSCFEHFKGGKGVACYGGFVICTNYILAIIGLSTLLITFFIKKKVSMGSVIGVIVVVICAFLFSTINYFYPHSIDFMFYFGGSYKMSAGFCYAIACFIYTTLVIIFHIPNIKRLIENKEPDTHFKKD